MTQDRVRRDATAFLRLTKAEKERYQQDAQRKGLPFPDWMRRALEAEAQRGEARYL